MIAEKNKIDVPVRAVGKALALLEMIVMDHPASKGLTLTDLSKRMGMRLNSTRNILKTMMICGMIAQDENRRYVPGPKIVAIGRLNSFRGAKLAEIEEILADFSGSTREASLFVVLCRGKRTVLARIQSSHVIRVDESGESPDVFALPTGRVLASYAPPDELESMIEANGWPGKAWNDIADHAGLSAATRAIREKGWCLINPDRHNTVSMAVPVLDAKGGLIGAIGAYAPCFRCPSATIRKMREELVRTAQRISAGIENTGSDCFGSRGGETPIKHKKDVNNKELAGRRG